MIDFSSKNTDSSIIPNESPVFGSSSDCNLEASSSMLTRLRPKSTNTSPSEFKDVESLWRSETYYMVGWGERKGKRRNIATRQVDIANRLRLHLKKHKSTSTSESCSLPISPCTANLHFTSWNRSAQMRPAFYPISLQIFLLHGNPARDRNRLAFDRFDPRVDRFEVH